MYLEIISPEATLFTGEIESLTLPGANGSFQILENHAPIVSTLSAGTVKIKGNIHLSDDVKELFTVLGKDEMIFAIGSGTVEMQENKIILLSD